VCRPASCEKRCFSYGCGTWNVPATLDTHHDNVRHVWPVGGDLFDVQIHKCGLPIGDLTSQFLANVYLDSLDQFIKHELRVKGYVRYLDDFLLFGNDPGVLKDQGRRVQEKLSSLHLRMHPDKYRLIPTRCGVDFVGFLVHSNGRVRVRTATARRFHQRFQAMRWEMRLESTLTTQVNSNRF